MIIEEDEKLPNSQAFDFLAHLVECEICSDKFTIILTDRETEKIACEINPFKG